MYLLHLADPSGVSRTTVTFHSALARDLAMLALSAQAVTLRCEDVAVAR